MNKKSCLRLSVTSTILSILLIGCGSSSNNDNSSEKFFNTGSILPYTQIGEELDNGAKDGEKFFVRNGGYGSAAAAHPSEEKQFYALTDRGPNAAYTGNNGVGKKFPVPDYTPRIGLFEIQSDNSVKKIKDILLKRPDGTEISGLPNTSALGGTGETPYDAQGNTIKDENGNIKLDDYGLDGEGLAVLKDGTFWVSDEYGPHMVHFDSDGKEIERINPFASDSRNTFTLPSEFSYRRANRGMEGLTITPDQKTLVGIMQSTMYLPSSEVKDLNITRIVTVDVETGETKQYLYKQEKNQNSNSEIVALSNDEFLIIERDGKFIKDTSDLQKNIYKVNLSSGTELENVSLKDKMIQDDSLGLTIDGLTLEQVVLNSGWEALENSGIYPISKQLYIDMVDEVEYPHDKMEGLIVFKDGKLGIINDDDFATWSTNGILEQKYLDANKKIVDTNTLYVVNPPKLASNLEKIGSYNTNEEAGSEIVAYDKDSKRMFVTNGANNAIDVIDISNPTSTSLVKNINLSSYGTGVNSVAVYNGKVAVATENKSSDGLSTNSKGNIVFFDINGTHLKTVEAGYLPDMLTFNEDGSKVIVANEGEPNGDYSVDPEGSIGIINTDNYSYTEIALDIQTTNANDGTAVRLGGTPSNSQTKDLEPEYITVLGNYAYVTLQENNALAKVNLTTNTLEYIKSFGAKDYSSENTIDIEENATIEMKNYPGLFALYQPDSIASYSYNNSTYLVTANEGDGREYLYDDENGKEKESYVDEKKISKLDLDSSIANAYENDNDLKVMIDLGDTDNDGEYEELYTYGARSFSIWDENADLIWDSGDEISKKIAQLQPELFNQDEGKMDARSGNKGGEPEALTVGTIDNKTYAFIGLERQNAILIYDITNPTDASFVNYIETGSMGDISPEGMKFISSNDSSNEKDLLLVSYEMSGSTVIYEVK